MSILVSKCSTAPEIERLFLFPGEVGSCQGGRASCCCWQAFCHSGRGVLARIRRLFLKSLFSNSLWGRFSDVMARSLLYDYAGQSMGRRQGGFQRSGRASFHWCLRVREFVADHPKVSE